ncbi:uncharacterized protein LOC126623529 isoform X2 [Malus sylvestris]|uniref:uncharacterized protein LOC126623529 isoform X2 n=1 Tax=Malus sylvestris TaxID=3752 RepID=UPI0021AC0EE1|nr:uncharacterized protein LOC126623529 isoform X2 [Malus sylvestris]
MAPRARGRKKDTRMDAAIDATREMGFDEKLVRATVNDLLKVYKGDNRTENPWRFIEEGSYTLLVEQLLEKVEAHEAAEKRDAASQDNNAPQDDAAMQDDAAPLEDVALLEDASPLDDAAPLDDALAAVPSNTAILSTCDNAPQDAGSVAGTARTAILSTCSEAVNITLLTEDPCDSASHTNGPIPASMIKMPDAKDGLRVDSLPPRRSRPYYGWVCSSDEEYPVEVASSPLSELVKLLIRPDKKKKRKSRWDMGPEDM